MIRRALLVYTARELHACDGCLNVKKMFAACFIKPLFINVPTAALKGVSVLLLKGNTVTHSGSELDEKTVTTLTSPRRPRQQWRPLKI